MIRSYIFYCLLPVFMGVLVSCGDNDMDDVNDISAKLVVEAYVYANEPISHVKLSGIHSDGQAQPVPVTTANVKVIQGGVTFQLAAVDTSAGIYNQENVAAIPNDDQDIHLTILYEGKEYNASSVMPPPVTGLGISDSIINIIPGDEELVVATLSWNHIENAEYALFVRNLDENADFVELYIPDPDVNPFYQISSTNTIELRSTHFKHYGAYELYVTVVNAEYKAFYNRLTGISNAHSNISGGLGVFTAFNGSSVSVVVQ